MKKLLIFFLIFFCRQGHTQDIKGAYIQTKKLTGYTYSITVTLFTDPALNISRLTIPMSFGDGTNGSFTISSTSTANGFVIKTYSGTHSYAGPGTYNAYYLDTYRVAGIKNITNSQTQQIYVGALINIKSWVNNNSGPTLSSYPSSIAVDGNQVVYNSGSFDVDSDSLSYELINCFANNYYLPSNATLNSSTGEFNFHKDSLGSYAFSYLIREWRKNSSGNYEIIGVSQLEFLMEITPDVGITETSQKETHVKAFPNPATNELKIALNELLLGHKIIEIVNASGQIVTKEEFESSLNISELPKGIYILKVSVDGILFKPFKFIKE